MLKYNICLTLLISLVSGLLFAQNAIKPKVLIITTRGTIASVTDSSSIEGPELVRAVPQLLEYADIEVEEFSNIGSSQMTPEMWLKLVQRIGAVLDETPAIRCIHYYPRDRYDGRDSVLSEPHPYQEYPYCIGRFYANVR